MEFIFRVGVLGLGFRKLGSMIQEQGGLPPLLSTKLGGGGNLVQTGEICTWTEKGYE